MPRANDREPDRVRLKRMRALFLGWSETIDFYDISGEAKRYAESRSKPQRTRIAGKHRARLGRLPP